jgi:23S rRNA (cytidine1920-2'-O)/16S rRNA (cytidine1409-2'-O)-methyltransferase
MAATRSAAHDAIVAGRVLVAGSPAGKPATLVGPDVPITFAGDAPRWVSRAGAKLDAAFDRFAVPVEGANALDVGASTGGFTEVLLDRGAGRVVALDVGYGQLAWRLQTHPAVVVVDRTNFRTVDVATLGAPFDVVVMDVSFIGAALLAAQLAAAGRPGSEYVVLVKPQFELDPSRVGGGGIVRDPVAHSDAVQAVAAALTEVGIGVQDAMPSPITGSKGNREFLIHGRRDADGIDARRAAELALA